MHASPSPHFARKAAHVAALVVSSACGSTSHPSASGADRGHTQPAATPSAIAPPPVSTAGWASALDTDGLVDPLRETLDDLRMCRSDEGCSRTVHLPACPADITPRTTADVLANASELRGGQVVVRGTLSPRAGAHPLECGAACCTRSYGHVRVVGGEAALSLRDDRRPDAFACKGDESGACCSFPVDGQLGTSTDPVLVAGTLEETPPDLASSGTFESWLIARPSFCVVGAKDAPPVSVEADGLGCVVAGQRRSPYEVFTVDGRSCGCHAGGITCDDAAGACFRAGTWYPDGSTRPVSHSCQRLECAQARWRLTGTECEGSWRIYFEPRSSTFMAGQAVLLAYVAEFLFATGLSADLRVHGSTAEGTQFALAVKRRDAVMVELGKHGLAPHRFSEGLRAAPWVAPEDHKNPAFYFSKHTDSWVEVQPIRGEVRDVPDGPR